jgi:hypothetical protein
MRLLPLKSCFSLGGWACGAVSCPHFVASRLKKLIFQDLAPGRLLFLCDAPSPPNEFFPLSKSNKEQEE